MYAITLAGWSSNNKYSLLGGMRSSAQMISYELALGLSTVGVLLLTGSLSLVDIVRAQQGVAHLGPLPVPRWFVFTQPVAFAIFLICAFAETNRAPFDLPEGESELVGGFHTEYGSMKWAMFYLGEYMNMITISAITATLFLGGWSGPWLPESLQFVWFFVKLFAMLFLFMWVRWTLPAPALRPAHGPRLEGAAAGRAAQRAGDRGGDLLGGQPMILLLFVAFAAVLVVSSLLVILHRSPVAIALIW